MTPQPRLERTFNSDQEKICDQDKLGSSRKEFIKARVVVNGKSHTGSKEQGRADGGKVKFIQLLLTLRQIPCQLLKLGSPGIPCLLDLHIRNYIPTTSGFVGVSGVS